MKKIITTLLFFCVILSNAQTTTELLIPSKPATETSNVTFYNNKCYIELKEDGSKYWPFSSISTLIAIDQNTMAYSSILKRDSNEVVSDIVFQNTGTKLYCYYLSYKIFSKKIYLQKILIENNFIMLDSVLINLPISQYGSSSLYSFLRFKTKMSLTNNELFSKIVYSNDSTQEIIMNIQRFDSALVSKWNTDLKSTDASIYSNSNKTIIYYFAGNPFMNIKIYNKSTQTFSNASYPILDIIPFNTAKYDFIHWNQKDYMVIINDSNNDEIIDNTYLFSFINDSSFQLEKTFGGGKRVQCFNENDSLVYIALQNDSTNSFSFYNTGYTLIGSGKSRNNKSVNKVVINNNKKVGTDYWYFGSYLVYPTYYPYIVKSTASLGVKSETVNKDFGLQTFPNPTSKMLNIEAGNNQFALLQILDTDARIIFSDDTGTQAIDVSGLSSGVYFINVITSGGNVLKGKFVKM